MSAGTTVLLVNDLLFPTGDSASFRPIRSFIPLVGGIACKRLLLNLRSITQSELGSTDNPQSSVQRTRSADAEHKLPTVVEEPADDWFFSFLDEEARPPIPARLRTSHAVGERQATHITYTYLSPHNSTDILSDGSSSRSRSHPLPQYSQQGRCVI
ncbi:hypothetical protein DL93DRAFT_601690 [Clavulina sp. PMI_390]|nr:hypothetical protein DL93DRAFT_601690 [Clavulina sp. PMI_390]